MVRSVAVATVGVTLWSRQSSKGWTLKDDLRTFDVECLESGCKATVSVSVDAIARKRVVTCPRGHKIPFDESRAGEARKVQKALDDLDEALKRLGS